jgi:hypothetical protein
MADSESGAPTRTLRIVAVTCSLVRVMRLSGRCTPLTPTRQTWTFRCCDGWQRRGSCYRSPWGSAHSPMRCVPACLTACKTTVNRLQFHGNRPVVGRRTELLALGFASELRCRGNAQREQRSPSVGAINTESLDDSTVDKMLVHNLVDVFCIDVGVPDCLGIDHHGRTVFALR